MSTPYDQRPSEAILYRQAVTDDTITDSMWSLTPGDGTIQKYSQNAKETSALVSALTSGTKYTLTVLVTCQSGQVFERSCIIRCQ